MSGTAARGWLGLAAGLMAAGAAQAADVAAPGTMPQEAAGPAAKPIEFAFGARVQSDYIFRGISQSDRKPSLQGYGELQLLDNLIYAAMPA